MAIIKYSKYRLQLVDSGDEILKKRVKMEKMKMTKKDGKMITHSGVAAPADLWTKESNSATAISFLVRSSEWYKMKQWRW